MGGTDGPLTRVDPATGRVFVTLGIVGHYRTAYPTSPFTLSSAELNRTVVMMSDDNGATWKRAGLLASRGWRVDVVPRQNGWLAFGHSGVVSDTGPGYAYVIPQYPIGFIPQYHLYGGFKPDEPQPHNGWTQTLCDHLVLYTSSSTCTKASDDYIKINLIDRTSLVRSPSSHNLLLAHMDTLENGKGDGYRLYLFDDRPAFTSRPPIAPQGASADNFVLHVTPIDVGRGPILYYWYDINTATKRAAIRGRLITGDYEWTEDFGVSRSLIGPRSFDVTAAALFYGDYHTAGGYYEPPVADPISGTYHYYPVWIEPDGNVHFAHVKFHRPVMLSVNAAAALGYFVTTPSARPTPPELIDVSRLVAEGEEGSTATVSSGRADARDAPAARR
jgi:hypothetical protein